MPEPTDKHDSGDLGPQVSTLLKDLDAAAPEAAGAAAAPDAADPELSRAVDELLSKEPAAPGPSAPEPSAAASAEAGDIATLDSELAQLADEMIAGEFEEGPEAEPAVPVAVAAPTPEAAGAPVAREPVVRVEAPVAGRPRPGLPLRAAVWMSSPLRGRPPIVRDVVGYMASFTAFLALCVWASYLIFGWGGAASAPKAPTAEHAAAHGDGHAEAPKKAEKKGKPAAVKADAGHGGH